MSTPKFLSHPPSSLSLPRTALAILFFAGLLAQAAVAESLTGTVTNQATGRTLEGVRVAIKGANSEVFTDC